MIIDNTYILLSDILPPNLRYQLCMREVLVGPSHEKTNTIKMIVKETLFLCFF